MSRRRQIRTVTKYEQIEQLIRERIRKGELRAGQRIESEYELAERLGVHRFTVNKAIGNLVRAGVLYRVQGKGTFASDIQPSAGSRTIGILHGGPADSLFSSPFYGPIIKGIYDTEKFNLFFFGTRRASVLAGPAISAEDASKVDGFFALEIFNDEYLGRIAAQKPLVLIDYYSETLGLPGVVIDNAGGAAEATRHLLSLGHECIACVSEDPRREHTDPAWQDRRKGWLMAMEETGVSRPARWFIPLPSRSSADGAAAAEQMLSWSQRPTAAFVASDGVAVAFMKRLQEAGVAVPAEFSLVSFGDDEVCQLVEPALSAVSIASGRMGLEAARLMEQLLAGAALDEARVEVATRLIVRASSGPPPAQRRKGLSR